MPRLSCHRSRTGLALAATVLLAAACAGDRPADPAPEGASCEDLTAGLPEGTPHHLRLARPLMGTVFAVRAVVSDPDRGCAAMHAALDEVARQEALFSEYRSTSDISAINREAGRSAVEVDPEVFGLIDRSRTLSQVTGGAFDVTFAACGRWWSVREQRVPDAADLAACLPEVGYRDLVLDSQRASVFLPRPAMRIGVGAIAKGYGVDRAADVLQAHGVGRFAIDGGGDLRVEGEDIDGPWTVKVAHPRDPSRTLRTLRLDRGAIVTSGDYLRFFERDGVRYHHILDPATGMPARRSVSVTVLAATAMEADALATGLFVMGPDRGVAAAGALPGVEVLFVTPDLEVRASAGFPADGGARLRAHSQDW